MSEKRYAVTEDAGRRIIRSVRKGEAERVPLTGPDSEDGDADSGHFQAVTVADSYTDQRYLVRRARLTNDGDADTANPTWEEFPTGHPFRFECTARNTMERGTHATPVGTPVLVFWDYDKTTDPGAMPRYWIVADPIGNPQYESMALIGVAQNQRGWGWLPAHAFDDPE